jgi:hypothetical protein
VLNSPIFMRHGVAVADSTVFDVITIQIAQSASRRGITSRLTPSFRLPGLAPRNERDSQKQHETKHAPDRPENLERNSTDHGDDHSRLGSGGRAFV